MHRLSLIVLVILLAILWPMPRAQAQETTLLINGMIVTPGGVINDGWIAIQGGKIKSITATKPSVAGARVLITRDIVFPGFVDLHNHPLYGVFPRWTPPKTYGNRYEWRAADEYWKTIQGPEGKLVATHFCDMDAYVELKALAGGTTSLLGIYEPADVPKVPACVAGLVRNLDWSSGFYGTAVGEERLGNILGVRPRDLELSARDVAFFRQGKFDVVAVHTAEGQRGDAESRGEFARLTELKLLGPKTTVVHGVALTEDDFIKLRRAGSSFIWSPRSNFELYGETANIPVALGQNVTVALAPDWSPTGSTNMLAELVYARSVSEKVFGGLISPKRLFDMATSVPARIAKIDDKVGSLAAGLYADLFLLRGDAAKDVFETLVNAKPEDVTLAMVSGQPLYGARDYLTALGVSETENRDMCGTARAVNRTAFPKDGLAGVYARLSQALAAENIQLAGLAECIPKAGP